MSENESRTGDNAAEATLAKKPAQPRKVLTPDEYKALISTRWVETDKLSKIAEEAVDNMTRRYGKDLFKLMDLIDTSLELQEEDQFGRKTYSMQFNLSDADLEFLVVKIPIICVYIQEQINRRALDAAIAQYIKEDTITEKLKSIGGRDAKERLRNAEQQAEIEAAVHLIKSQVYSNLKSLVDRADRVYEGLKKIIDGRNRDKFLSARASAYNP